MTNEWELLFHNNRLMHRLGSTFTDFCSLLLFPSFCFPIFGWQFVLTPHGQASMGLPMLDRTILLLEISTLLVALGLAAVNGESSPYSFPPSLNW